MGGGNRGMSLLLKSENTPVDLIELIWCKAYVIGKKKEKQLQVLVERELVWVLFDL